ncbi:Putative arrestin-like domain-containing protein [Colletotrichum destructivum]|uniref:Arrestin-like domain-containing protein n=1 Tax=Colletotrichum destructivum TaxID=34406 RepID=A0AAX4HW83_9PEZI|nr:Putative arrestin-like domain-containing protein [Colletotrichum destructivum]
MPTTMTDSERSRRTENWIPTSTRGGVYYCPRYLLDPPTPQQNRLPTPPIRARQVRPRSIHITSWPSGFVPHELRPQPERPAKRRRPSKAVSPTTTSLGKSSLKFSIKQFFSLSQKQVPSRSASCSSTLSRPTLSRPPSRATSLLNRLSTYREVDLVVPEEDTMALRSAAMAEALRPPLMSSTYNTPGQRSSLMSVRSAKSNVTSMVTEIPKPVAHGSGVSCSILMAEPNIFLTGFDHDGHRQHSQGGTALLRGKLQLKVTKNVKIKGVSLKLVGKARTEWPEGIPPLKVDLYEEESLRTQVLTFFNAVNDGWETEYGNQCVYMLKNSSSNSSSTNLPVSSSPRNSMSPSMLSVPHNRQQHGGLTAKELKRLSLQSNQSRSFGKGDNPSGNQAKGYKVFYPGVYEYTFELPIDHHQLETTKLQYGSVKWELQATVERAGAFKPNLHGSKEVAIVRVPDQLSLEMTEPISISRQWEDQLHYDIIISGKSFPIGTKIPIAFKLTPLAKVQVHKLKVFVTESVEYWTNDRRVTRKDPGRKILLLEKTAGKPLDAAYASSDVRVLNGGELTPRQRREARESAAMRRAADASRHGVMPQPLPEPVDNILGDLDLGLESYWGSTEIEMNVQLPTCETMAKSKELRLHPDCSWKNVNVYHWIKIVMRISRLDPEDPTGTKRRHFEISIDSPFTVLNCRATQANTSLPEYSGPDVGLNQSRHTSCGCPDAVTISGPAEGSPNNLSTGALTFLDGSDNLPAPPQAAHLPSPQPTTSGPGRASPPNSQTSMDPHADTHPRPIHLLRVPSYNPPAFDAETPPPPHAGHELPLQTPPPQYDIIVGTPSVDGMADYFARLADYGYDEAEEDSDSDEGPARISERGGRVNVAHPRTPGGRRAPSRSLDIRRPPLELRLESLPALRRNDVPSQIN